MKTSDPRHLLIAGLIGFVTAVPVILGIQGCADREPVKPVVVVPEEGPRELVILRESEETEPEQAQVVTLLRTGDKAKYLADKNHALTVLDDDLPEATRHVTNSEGIARPTLLIYDGSKLLKAAPLPASADAVIDLLKAHGG